MSTFEAPLLAGQPGIQRLPRKDLTLFIKRDFLDAAATGTTCRVLAGLEKRDRHVLAEIDAAEARLAPGTYGVCVMCAWAIPFDRLRAIPTARLCVVCEEVMERSKDPRIASKTAAPAA